MSGLYKLNFASKDIQCILNATFNYSYVSSYQVHKVQKVFSVPFKTSISYLDLKKHQALALFT